MELILPKYVNCVILSLESAGFEAYAVGGCVRDMLMGIVPKDYDITTNATPKQIKSIFKNTADTGIKHGTVTVISCGVPIEVTTYRTEYGYSDNRRPDKVEFVSNIKEDLSRRDFTVNAICYNQNNGIVDLFSGQADINAKILKAVGDADTRFKEDALRILRLIRFKSVLDFDIEENTLNAAKHNAHLLSYVSSERIYGELKKAVEGINPAALEILIKCGGLESIGIKDCKGLKKLTLLKSRELKFYAFLKQCECDINAVLDSLKAENKTKTYINALEELNKNATYESRYEIKRLLNRYDIKPVTDYLEYISLFSAADTKVALSEIRDILNLNEPYKISHLKIDGNDLKTLGITGKDTGDTLEFLLEKVTDNPSLNQKEKLFDILNTKR